MRRRVARASAGRLLFGSALLALGLPAGAESLPRLETGVGAVVGVVPTYRGASHYGVVAFPFPYFAYRGERLRLGRQGAGLRALRWADFHLGVSGAVTVPGNDGEDPARSGMPDLDPTFEFGPSLDWRQASGDMAWCVCVGVRYATSTDFTRADSVGWVVNPQLRVRHVNEGEYLVTTAASFGPKFGDHRYHAYVYDVQPQYATASRPAFSAPGGYGGVSAGLSVGARKGDWGAGAGVLADWLDGAAFEDSPLVKEQISVTVGLWVTYFLWSSGSTDAAEDVSD